MTVLTRYIAAITLCSKYCTNAMFFHTGFQFITNIIHLKFWNRDIPKTGTYSDTERLLDAEDYNRSISVIHMTSTAPELC